MTTPDNLRIDLSCAISSFEEERDRAHSFINEGIRVGCGEENNNHKLYAKDIIVDGVVTLASLNCFDSYYQVGSTYLQTRQEYEFGFWAHTSSLCGTSTAGCLGHLVRLDIACKKDSFGLQSLAIKNALCDVPNDKDILCLCRKIVNNMNPVFRSNLEKILKK